MPASELKFPPEESRRGHARTLRTLNLYEKSAVSEFSGIFQCPARRFLPLKTKELPASWTGHSRNRKNAGLTLNVHENKKDIELKRPNLTSKTLNFQEKQGINTANLECL